YDQTLQLSVTINLLRALSLFGAPAVVPDAENLNDPVVQTRRRSIRKQAERSGTEFGGGRHEDTSANRGRTSPDDGILLCPDASCQSLGSVDLSQFENGDHFGSSVLKCEAWD